MKKLLTIALLLSAALAQAATPFSTRTYKLEDFTIIDVSNVVKVVYTQGEPYSVKLTGRTDWLDLMEVTTSGGILTVKAKNSKKFKNVKPKDQPDGHHNFILHLTAPCLENILLKGVSTLEAKRLTPDFLHVSLSGVSKLIVGEIEVPSFYLEISGVSKVDAKQIKCKELKANVSGSSNLDVEQVNASKCVVTINGASNVKMPKVNKAEEATFNVGGASKINVGIETNGLLQMGLSGASKGEMTFKGGRLRSFCKGASKLDAKVNCESIQAGCDGASKTTFTGTADKVEIERGGVATNIDTSRLNQF